MSTAMRQREAEPAQEVGITSFFDAPFTAVSNSLLQSLCADPNASPTTRLLLFIARFSTGYLKADVVLRESFILEQTGMSRSSLYKAKNDLVASGHITIGHTQTGNCVYRLTAQYQCLKGATSAQERANQKWGSAATDGGGPTLETPTNKENKENLDQHHPTATGTDPDDVFFVSEKLSVANGSLIDRLKQLGITEFMAHRLVKQSSIDIINRAIQRLQTLNVLNPAGYLVTEVLQGGYREKPDPTKAQRDLHRQIQEKRQAERDQLEQTHQTCQNKAKQLWQKFLELSPEYQLELKQRIHAQAEREGFARLRGWGEEHPTWRGLILEELVLWEANLPQVSTLIGHSQKRE